MSIGEKMSEDLPGERRNEREQTPRVSCETDPRRELDLKWHATTILSVRKGDRVAIGGDGQVTLGTQVMKGDAVKIRKLLDGQVLVGFAGSAADGFALMERFEGKLKEYPMNVSARGAPNWPSCCAHWTGCSGGWSRC